MQLNMSHHTPVRRIW